MVARPRLPQAPPSGNGQSIECSAKLFVAGADYVAKAKHGSATITQTDEAGRHFRYEVRVGSQRFSDSITFSR